MGLKRCQNWPWFGSKLTSHQSKAAAQLILYLGHSHPHLHHNILFLLSLVYQSDVNHRLSCLRHHHQTEAKTKLILFWGHHLSYYRSSTIDTEFSLMPRLVKRRVIWSLATSFSLCPFLHNMHSFETHDESPVESKLKKLTNRACCLEVLMSMSLSLMTTSAVLQVWRWPTVSDRYHPFTLMFSPAFVTTIIDL